MFPELSALVLRFFCIRIGTGQEKRYCRTGCCQFRSIFSRIQSVSDACILFPFHGWIPFHPLDASHCRQHRSADNIPLLQIHDLTHTVPARYRYGKIRGPIRAVAFVNLKPYGFIGQFLIVVLLAEMAQENLLKPVMEHAV